MGPSLSFALLTLSSSAHLPNLSSLSRSDFPNSLYLFAFPHFTRIPVTKLILPTLSSVATSLTRIGRHTFGLDKTCGFPLSQALVSKRTSHLLVFFNSTSCTAPRLFIKTGFPPVVGTAEPLCWTTVTTCYGLLTLVRGATTSSSTVAASTTASTWPQCGLPNRKVNQYQSCIEDEVPSGLLISQTLLCYKATLYEQYSSQCNWNPHYESVKCIQCRSRKCFRIILKYIFCSERD